MIVTQVSDPGPSWPSCFIKLHKNVPVMVLYDNDQRIKFHAELWLPWQPIGKPLKNHKKTTACQISK